MQVKKLTKDAVVKEIKSVCSALLPTQNSNQETKEEEISDHENETALQKVQRMRQLASRVPEPDREDLVEAEVDRFYGQQCDWYQLLKNQCVDEDVLEKVGQEKRGWEDLDNFEMISKYFDAMNWWAHLGKQLFPKMYTVACLIAALPDSNGHQERTFSTAQWMDDRRRRRQSDATFEMKTLLYRNRDFMSLYQNEVDIEMKRKAAQKTRDAIQAAAKRRDEMAKAGTLKVDDAEDDNCLEGGDDEEDGDELIVQALNEF